MEDKTILTDITQNNVTEEIAESEIQEENFEISEEAKQQSSKFFKFGSKPKKEKRKFESFEIVKTYTPKEKTKESDFDKILEVSNNQVVDEETVTVSSTTKAQKVKLKVRPQGKIILALISAVIIMLSSLSIYNAVKISKLNESINNINNEITIQDFNIDKAIKNLDKLTLDATSPEQAQNLGLEQAAEPTQITLYERQEVNKTSGVTNWFNKLCNFISKLFGG